MEEPLARALGAGTDDSAFIEELGNLTLEGIRKHGPAIEAKKAGIKAQLLEEASGACGTFIESADAVRRAHEEVLRVSRQLETLEKQLPQAAVQAEAMLSEATASIEARESNSLLLRKHADVLEVLEQPQLMDTCVRNGLVDEALALLEPLGLGRVLLATRDAHDVYARAGFEPLPRPQDWMIRVPPRT